jgi:glycosyltransferase involved in cell wall biosynthesis
MSINSKLEFFRRALDYWKIYGFREFLILSYRYSRGRFFELDASLDTHAELLEQERIDELATPSEKLFNGPLVAIIAELSLPQCKKYRVMQKMEILDRLGVRHDYAAWQDSARAMDLLQYATVAIFYRVPSSEQFSVYLKECHRLGVKTLYDIDDPVFSSAIYAANANLGHLEVAERASLINGCEQFLSAMKQCDHLVGSTPSICRLMGSEAGREALLWRNLLDTETQRFAQRSGLQEGTVRNAVKIGYASGSRAHEADFRTITRIIVHILEHYAQVELHILGHLNLPDELARFKGRVVRHEFSSFEAYMSALSTIDISIVPLLRDEFNDSKSAIRYMEAAALGIPTVATSTGDFVNIIEHGTTGYLATNPEAWRNGLESLIVDERLRNRMGGKARDQVTTQFSTINTGYLDHIDERIVKVINGH